MARLPLIDLNDMSTAQREQYARFPSNLTRTLLLLDERLARALPETANALRASSLNERWREAVILRVAALSFSPYERMQHLGQARMAGYNDGQITDIESRRFAALSQDLSVILAFVDECVATTHVSDRAFTAIRTVLSSRDIATVIVLVGHYMTVARLTGTLEVELDEHADSWTSEH